MIKITNLHTIKENTQILRGLDLAINQGEIHAILGPNGAGKSTLGRVLLGDDSFQVTKGKIAINNQDWLKLDTVSRARKGFMYTFQHGPAIDGVSVFDFLMAAKKILIGKSVSHFRAKKSLQSWSAQLRLPDDFIQRELNVGFSGGERKKLEVLTVLFLQPRWVFLDEIDSGVDIDTVKIVGETLSAFAKEHGSSMIVVTHTTKILHILQPNQAHVLVAGQIVQSGQQSLISQIEKEGFASFLPTSPLRVLS